jgi:hypothetical protein
MRRQITWCLVLVLILLLAAPPGALAAKKTIKPLQFKLLTNPASQVYWQTPVSIGADATSVSTGFIAPLKLPVGAKITGLKYWHTGNAPGTICSIYYADESTDWNNEVLVIQADSDATTPPFSPVEVDGTLQAGVDNVVRKGRKYMVTLMAWSNSFVWGVEVTYKK